MNGNSLLHDRRFWSGLLGLLIIIVSAFHPELEDNLDHIVPAVVGIIGTMIGGFSLEHAAEKHKPAGNDKNEAAE